MSAGRILRVVFLIPRLDANGAERVVLRTATGLDRSRFEPIVVAIVRASGRLADELATARVPSVVLDQGTRPRVQHVYRVFRWLQQNPPDVLLTYMFHANVIGRLMRRVGAVPAVICSERSASAPMWRVLLNRYTARWMDAMTVNSLASHRYWASRLRIPEGRISIVRNGVDTNVFSPGTGPAGPVIGVLARLHPANGHDWLLDALARLDRLAPEPWTCALAGTGREERALRARVNRLGLADRIRFLGHCAEPVSFLRSLILSVHPALVSGMPNAVLEAMACGLPVVATAVGGTPEAIEHGTSGWLVEPGDTEGTAALLATLLRTPDLRETAGINARARVVELFSLEAMVSGLEGVVTELLERRMFAATVASASQ